MYPIEHARNHVVYPSNVLEAELSFPVFEPSTTASYILLYYRVTRGNMAKGG